MIKRPRLLNHIGHEFYPNIRLFTLDKLKHSVDLEEARKHPKSVFSLSWYQSRLDSYRSLLYFIRLTKDQFFAPLEEGDIDEATHPGVFKLYKMDISSKTLLICIAKKEQEEGLLFELMIILNNAFLIPEYS